MWEEKVRKGIRYIPLSRNHRLELTKKLFNREFKKEIQELRKKKAHRDEVASKENDHRFELQLLTEQQEELYSDRLLKRARQLRVARPTYPKWGDDGLEPDEDWIEGREGVWLSNQGIAKVREEIRKEEKWRQERRAHWMQFGVTLTALIGAVSGWVAFFLK